MRELVAWAARGIVLLSVGWLAWTFMPPELRGPVERVLVVFRR